MTAFGSGLLSDTEVDPVYVPGAGEKAGAVA